MSSCNLVISQIMQKACLLLHYLALPLTRNSYSGQAVLKYSRRWCTNATGFRAHTFENATLYSSFSITHLLTFYPNAGNSSSNRFRRLAKSVDSLQSLKIASGGGINASNLQVSLKGI